MPKSRIKKPQKQKKRLNIIISVAAGLIVITSGYLVLRSNAATNPCPVAYAHRGASLTYPENTIPAVNAALSAGTTWIENDVRFTKSNVPMILHDADVYRTSNSAVHKNIQDMYYPDIRALDFGYPKKFGTKFAGTKIPTLYEWLIAVKNGGANGLVEFKTDATSVQVDEFIKRIEDAGMADRVIVQSFYPGVINKVKAKKPNYKVAIIVDPTTEDTLASNEYAAKFDKNYHVQFSSIQPDRVAYWHSAGTKVLAWTPDNATDWARLRDAGVDGIVTNDAPGLVNWCKTQ